MWQGLGLHMPQYRTRSEDAAGTVCISFRCLFKPNIIYKEIENPLFNFNFTLQLLSL